MVKFTTSKELVKTWLKEAYDKKANIEQDIRVFEQLLIDLGEKYQIRDDDEINNRRVFRKK